MGTNQTFNRAYAGRPGEARRGMIGVVDVGGGERGVYGSGVLDFCMERGIDFDYCVGVSAGAANLSSYLAGQV